MLLVASVALWASAACGRSESSVVAAEGNDGARDAASVQAQPDAMERVETVGDRTVASLPAAGTDVGRDAAQAGDGTSAGTLSPEDVSTGPVLQWTEFDPGIDYPGRVFSTGDGRVVIEGETLAGEPRLLSTSDGADWSTIRLPAGLSLGSADLTGPRWAVAGWQFDGQGDFGLGGSSARIYVSDDEGRTWTEVTAHVESPSLPEHAVVWPHVHAVATSGPSVVALLRAQPHMDFEALLNDRGLIPEGARFGGISTGNDSIEVWLHEESPQGDAHGPDGQRMSEVSMTLTYDELGLSEEQVTLLESPFGGEAIRVYSGAGTELVEAATLDAWNANAFGDEDGFVLLAQDGEGDATMLTSTDGVSWHRETLDSSAVSGHARATAFEPGDALWAVSTDGAESRLTRWSRDGDGITTIRLTRFGSFGGIYELHAGPAGVAAVAVVFHGDQPVGASGAAGLPSGSVAKDGYELRYGEPEGGITLWDLAADEPVYVFGPEILESDEPPAGVREHDDGDSFELTFEDPDTGQDLVTFTMEDLAIAFGMPGESQRSPSDPDMWLGWSADGTAWGWQTVQDAFGLADAEAHAGVAVGEDFVIASVVAHAPFEASASSPGAANGKDAIIESEAVDTAPPRQRWFIARVP